MSFIQNVIVTAWASAWRLQEHENTTGIYLHILKEKVKIKPDLAALCQVLEHGMIPHLMPPPSGKSSFQLRCTTKSTFSGFSYLKLFNFAVANVESPGGKRNLSGDLCSPVALHWLGRVTAASSWASAS